MFFKFWEVFAHKFKYFFYCHSSRKLIELLGPLKEGRIFCEVLCTNNYKILHTLKAYYLNFNTFVYEVLYSYYTLYFLKNQTWTPRKHAPYQKQYFIAIFTFCILPLHLPVGIYAMCIAKKIESSILERKKLLEEDEIHVENVLIISYTHAECLIYSRFIISRRKRRRTTGEGPSSYVTIAACWSMNALLRFKKSFSFPR